LVATPVAHDTVVRASTNGEGILDQLGTEGVDQRVADLHVPAVVGSR
jgi:hypothetical protein